MTKVCDIGAIFRQVMLLEFEHRNVAAAAEHFAEDAVVVDYFNSAAVHSGRAAIAGFIREFLELIPDAEHEVLDLVAAEDRLATAVLVRGTPWGQIEPVETIRCAFVVFREGKIVSERIYEGSRQLPLGPDGWLAQTLDQQGDFWTGA